VVADRPVMVADFTTNHLGNLNLLLRMVEAAATTGCDLIKMQKKDVESFYSAEKLAAPYDSPYGCTYREYRQIFEFSYDDFVRFDEHCRANGIRWFATAQDVLSLEFLLKFELPMIKVASCNARNYPFLKEIVKSVPTSVPIVVSLAGSTSHEIERVVDLFAARRLWLLHCVAEYPCLPHRLRLGNITELRRRFGAPNVSIGYSGHEVGVEPSVVAMELGASMIERHFCISRHSFVHHIECSLEPREFARLVELSHRPGERAEIAASVDPRAYRQDFGMTSVERNFLVKQAYGHDHGYTGSRFHV
jgi:N-acetylneuraminate synthase